MSVEYRRGALRDLEPGTLYRIMWLRLRVFVVEQQAAYPELDGRDLEPDAELFWAEEGGAVVATLRLLHDAGSVAVDGAGDGAVARIGRVATDASARGRGIAAELVRQAVARSEERWPRHPIVLDAQQHLGDWYARFGFVVSGEAFEEDGIPHVPMRRPAP